MSLPTRMDRKDFTPCAACGKGVMHTGLPLFFTIDIQRWGINLDAVQRQSGMEQFFGGAVALADVFSSGPIAQPVGGEPPLRVLICEACAMGSINLHAAIETDNDRQKAKAAA